VFHLGGIESDAPTGIGAIAATASPLNVAME
jgi:hypothetical protein